MRETIPAALAGERVDRVVAMLTGLTRSEVAQLVEAGGVRIGGRTASTRGRRLAEGETLEVDVPAPEEPADLAPDGEVDVPVIYADGDIIVVDKPAGLVVHPGAGHATGTMIQGLLYRYPDLAAVGDPARPGLVHRLDRGTSGLLVVAHCARAYDSLVGQLRARTVVREYVALVWGRVAEPAGVIDAPVGRSGRDPTRMAVTERGREARTTYRVTARFRDPAELSLLTCRLSTGRTHQIRVHLAAIGHPVVGDARYGGRRPGVAIGRPFLHAQTLTFVHPGTGQPVTFRSPLPADLAGVVGALRA